MRIVVAGGTGLIGTNVTAVLRDRGHEVVVASLSTGVDVVSGDGLEQSLDGADVVVDVTRPRTYDPSALSVFFTTAAQNMVAAEHEQGVRRHVALSAVGSALDSTIPYYRAKAAGEEIISKSGIPFTLAHSTQFFEFAGAIADSARHGDQLRLPDVLCQPAAAEDIAACVADITVEDAIDNIVDIAGPEVLPLAEFVRRTLYGRGDYREIVADPVATYFGGRLDSDDPLPKQTRASWPPGWTSGSPLIM